jgi:hypothetical protein
MELLGRTRIKVKDERVVESGEPEIDGVPSSTRFEA